MHAVKSYNKIVRPHADIVNNSEKIKNQEVSLKPVQHTRLIGIIIQI